MLCGSVRLMVYYVCVMFFVHLTQVMYYAFFVHLTQVVYYLFFDTGGILDRTGYQQLIVRCSDDGVVCESYKRQTGEPQDVFIKVITSDFY